MDGWTDGRMDGRTDKYPLHSTGHCPFGAAAQKGTEKWKIMYANVRGLRGKLNGLIETLHECNPQIFLFTETQLKIKFRNYHLRIQFLQSSTHRRVWRRHRHLSSK